MNISLGILFGMLAMLSWGASDFFIAKSVRSAGTFRTFVWGQIITVLLLAPVFLSYFPVPHISQATLGMIFLSGLFGVAANLAFFKSMQIGKLSIVTPIASCWAIVTIFLGIFFLHEALTNVQAIGAALAVLGAILVSFRVSVLKKVRVFSESMEKAIVYALAAALGYGITFAFIDVLVAELGWFAAILSIEITMLSFLFIYSAGSKKDVSFPKNVAMLVVMVGVLDAAAYLAYGAGVSSEYSAIVAPIGAASPAVTVLMGRVIFRETLETNQKAGVVSVLAGLVLLSL